MSRRTISAVLAGAVVVGTAGCAQTIEGRAIAKSPQVPVLAATTTTVDFKPCTDLDDSVLRKLEVDPSTIDPMSGFGDYACWWETYDGLYDVGIFADDYSLADFESDPSLVVEVHTTIRGRDALVVSMAGHDTEFSCSIVFEAGRSTVEVIVGPKTEPEDDTNDTSMCSTAVEYAEAVAAEIPEA